MNSFRARVFNGGLLLAMYLSSLATFAQTVPTIAVDVKVVNLPVTVRDKHNQIVRNLPKADFVLEEDGRPQSIRYFNQETNLPLTLGLLVDTSLSQRNVMEKERTASQSFLQQMITRAGDKAFVIRFDHEVELVQDLTSSRDKLQSAVGSLQGRDPRPGRGARRRS